MRTEGRTLACWFALLLLGLATASASAQTGSVKTQAQLVTEVGTTGCTLPTCNLPDSMQGSITPFLLRQTLQDLVATMFGGIAIVNGITYPPAPYVVGDILYADTTTSMARLPDVATGRLLASGGIGTPPTYCAACTLTTSLTTPLVIGGTAAGSTLTLRGTSSGSPVGDSVSLIATGTTGLTVAGVASSTFTINPSISNASGALQFGSWTGTFANQAYGLVHGVNWNFTVNGTGGPFVGFAMDLLPGTYAGTSGTWALLGASQVAVGSNNETYNAPIGVLGLHLNTPTTGSVVGIGVAGQIWDNSAKAVGVWGTSLGVNALGYGVVGTMNTNATTRVGGFFEINTAGGPFGNGGGTLPTAQGNAALIASNGASGASTDDLILGQRGTNVVFRLSSNGTVISGVSGSIAGALVLNGITSGAVTLAPTGAASGTLTLPSATDTLIGKATTDTLTNKTFDTAGAGNVLRINGTQVSAVTGSGSTAVLSTSPTFTTSIIDPLVVGGAAAGSVLELRSTSGTGSGDVVKITGGTNGAITMASFTQSAGGSAAVLTGTASVQGMANVATTSAVCFNTGNGLLTYDGTIGTCTVSDERLKNVIGPIVGALDKLLQIQGFYYTWKEPTFGTGRQIGIGAQTVERVFPELVQTDSTGRKSADYQRLVAPIIEALREMRAEIEDIKQRVPR